MAISLGVISMALVTNLSGSFTEAINDLEKDAVSVFPITVSNGEYEIVDEREKEANDKLIIKDKNRFIHTNKINSNYINYLKSIKEINYLSYNYDISLPLISDTYNKVDNRYLKIIPSNKYINDNYDILYGKDISSKYQILLKVDEYNNVDSSLLNAFNINTDITYKMIVGRKIRVILNDLYYFKNGEYYIINNDYHEIYDKSTIELEIVGIVKAKEEVDNQSYLYISNELIEEVIKINNES